MKGHSIATFAMLKRLLPLLALVAFAAACNDTAQITEPVGPWTGPSSGAAYAQPAVLKATYRFRESLNAEEPGAPPLQLVDPLGLSAFEDAEDARIHRNVAVPVARPGTR